MFHASHIQLVVTSLVAMQGADSHLSHDLCNAVSDCNDVVGVDLSVIKWRLQLVLSPQGTCCLIDQVRTHSVSTETQQSTEVMYLSVSTDRHQHIQTDTHRQTHIDRQAGTETERQTERQTDRQTEKQCTNRADAVQSMTANLASPVSTINPTFIRSFSRTR